MLGRQRRMQALQDETRLLHNFLDHVAPTRSYFQLLLVQIPPTDLTDAEMRTLEAELKLLIPVTQDMQNKYTIRMQIDLLDEKLRKIQSV